jgi:hypothetical protein
MAEKTAISAKFLCSEPPHFQKLTEQATKWGDKLQNSKTTNVKISKRTKSQKDKDAMMQ